VAWTIGCKEPGTEQKTLAIGSCHRAMSVIHHQQKIPPKDGICVLIMLLSLEFQAAFRTFPDLMQFVQTVIRCTLPSTIARTFCRFGMKRLGDLLCA